MSRGLTEEPEQTTEGSDLNDVRQAFDDLAGYVGMLSVRLETLEDLLAKALKSSLPEDEAADRRINGL
jgi:hypothetical protein